MSDSGFDLAPYSYELADSLIRELGVTEPVASVLVRRGYESVTSAREFLEAEESHASADFSGIDDAVLAIRSAIADGRLITVHGDYDVDGVTSTAIMIRTLRALGAECDWLIPGRVEDGYGVTSATIERLRNRGTGLLITVDCGITSVDEVRQARAAGIDVVVTDHHQPGPELPDCPIVHPVVSGYPCPDLCAAGVAYKLACALTGEDACAYELDLVGLATVADMVPLLGENRTLVRQGIGRARRSPRPGLRALMKAAGIAPETVDEGDFGFRIAPRINAAGRLYRADGAVELFLTDDEERAAAIAEELNRANLDRRETESEVLAEANRLFGELEAEAGEQDAIVLWGEDWHPGVVGICASRMAERHMRPAVLIALDKNGRGKGSGRSVPGYDLLSGFHACSELLTRHGGHRAAAGLEIEVGLLESFRQAFCEHAGAALAQSPVTETQHVDAVVGVEALGHELAGDLRRLAPFGVGNPPPKLLVPSARIADVRPMGEGGRHARFSLAGAGARAGGVAFGVGGAVERKAATGEPHDVTVRLELNEWNGAVEPRVLLEAASEQASSGAADWRCGGDEFRRRFEAELGREAVQDVPVRALGVAREHVDRTGESALAAIASLVSCGEPVLLVCADALWRRGIVERAVQPERLGGGRSAIVAARGSLERGEKAAAAVLDSGGLALTDWAALSQVPDLARSFRHVVIADPAPSGAVESLAATAPYEGSGFMHSLAGSPELSFKALGHALPMRDEIARVFRALRRLAVAGVGDLRQEAAAQPGGERSPESLARSVRVLMEMGVARAAGGGLAGSFEAVSSVRGDLASSESHQAHELAYEECLRFLNAPKRHSSKPLKVAA